MMMMKYLIDIVRCLYLFDVSTILPDAHVPKLCYVVRCFVFDVLFLFLMFNL